MKQLVADINLDKHILHYVLVKRNSDACVTKQVRRLRPGVLCRKRKARLLAARRQAIVGV